MDRERAAPSERTANMPRTHRIYEKDFRQEAVNLLLSNGPSLKRIAAEIGISADSLRT